MNKEDFFKDVGGLCVDVNNFFEKNLNIKSNVYEINKDIFRNQIHIFLDILDKLLYKVDITRTEFWKAYGELTTSLRKLLRDIDRNSNTAIFIFQNISYNPSVFASRTLLNEISIFIK